MDDFRIEVLIPLRQLERLDKEPYTSDERVDAEEVSSTFTQICIACEVSVFEYGCCVPSL